jgi:predicted GNAT superfamily acetyltransferase
MSEVDVSIRRAENLDDYRACVALQKQVWGYTEMEDVAAQPILMIGNRFGGNLLVATDRSGRYIGFSFAMPGWRQDERRFWWSHMTAVIPEYRNRDVGLALKLRQREEALAAGIDRIEWTFDPMQAMNAHFNVHKLGVIVREYEENVYGYTSSPLHSGLPTDRFVAEWNLDSDHVRKRLDASEGGVILRDIDRMPIINPGGSKADLSFDDDLLLLEIPADLIALKGTDLEKAKQWQESVRKACLHYFHRGYAVTDFIRVDAPQPQALYVLERNQLI